MNTPAYLALLLGLGASSLGTGLSAQGSFVNWETPHVHPMAMTPDGALLMAVNLPDNRLEVFSLASGSPVHQRSIPVGLDPVSVRARSNTQAWVVNHVSDSVSVVDLVLGQVTGTLMTDDEPCDLIFAGTPERAFVSCSQPSTVLVFDPANRLDPPVRIAIDAEEPRELALSPAGDKVYVAIFESGNRTTILSNGGVTPDDTPLNVVGLASGPHGGVNPVPNSGADFEPPFDAGLPVPPAVSLIVRQDAAGDWLDDIGGDWTGFISGNNSFLTHRVPGWSLPDHDVAVIDVATLSVGYLDRLMNLCMALAVNPADGTVAVVGTDATNEIRYEPNLNGRFLRVELALVDPTAATTPSLVDLNGHIDYSVSLVPQSERDKSISDPRGIVWNAAGTRAYVSGMGTNNLTVLDAAGARVGQAPTIEVGEGPTGIVLDEARERLYVLNKFEASISVVSTTTELELQRVSFFDPTPASIRVGRRHLYDAHETSGLGMTACAGCHADARLDRLSWDLGNPSGEMIGLDDLNLGAGIPFRPETIQDISIGFEDFHPMKGPQLTQTLQDIIGKEPFHWRGEQRGLEDFNPAFEGLLGDDEELSAEEMREFKAFLATIYFPPNPFRTLDNGLATDVPLDGHLSVGRFSPAGTQLPDGDAVHGRELYTQDLRCHFCHTLPTGMGTNFTWNGTQFDPVPPGPEGEGHAALIPPIFARTENFKIPSLRNLYERTGCEGQTPTSRAGFGVRHDGAIMSLAHEVSRPFIAVTNDQDVSDLIAFLLSMSGGIEPEGPMDDLDTPPGWASQSTHAAVGKQVTLNGAANPAGTARLATLLAEVAQRRIALVARARLDGLERGFYSLANGRFQSDRRTERFGLTDLLASAGTTTPLTFTAVPLGTERRIGADRDGDGYFDRDELERGFDPADPDSHMRPRAQRK